jgi:hypothetical protein
MFKNINWEINNTLHSNCLNEIMKAYRGKKKNYTLNSNDKVKSKFHVNKKNVDYHLFKKIFYFTMF